MPNYKRAYNSTTYFFTVVTHSRQPFLCTEQSRRLLREAINEVRARHPFKIDAWVLLPDHLHCIWTLPDGDSAYSVRWGMIKAGFSKRLNISVRGAHPTKSQSRVSRAGRAHIGRGGSGSMPYATRGITTRTWITYILTP
ncbi:MAG TPA: transposase [Nitrospirota bacterium]